jgi:hypothetical protein
MNDNKNVTHDELSNRKNDCECDYKKCEVKLRIWDKSSCPDSDPDGDVTEQQIATTKFIKR